VKHQKQLFHSNEGSVGLPGVCLDAVPGESRRRRQIVEGLEESNKDYERFNKLGGQADGFSLLFPEGKRVQEKMKTIF